MPRSGSASSASRTSAKATLAALGRAMPFVRHELGKRLRLKRIPELHLELDDTLERGTRVLQLLDELEAGHVPEDDAAGRRVAADAGRRGCRTRATPTSEPAAAGATAPTRRGRAVARRARPGSTGPRPAPDARRR